MVTRRGGGAAPHCDRRVVAADLREDWPTALVSAGFEPHRPSAWLAEGLTFYLPESAVRRLLDHTHRLAAPGSYLATDTMSTSPGPPEEFKELFASLGAPFIFTTDDPGGLLRDHGWEGDAISMIEIGRRLGVELRSGGRVVIARRSSGPAETG
jgi:methyltransferase (TIGR00027 family)